ncbi:MAG: GHKL domain-containing protein, partial [Clostridia bacterium]
EACDKKDDDRFVQCDITQCGGYLSIKIDNSCVDTMAQTTITTKNDKNLHGLGLKNVKAIARKYNGEVNFEKANNLFSIIVLLQNI